MKIEQLYIYPIKSFPVIQVENCSFTKDGFSHDRIFCLYDSNGVMQTRRNRQGMSDFKLELSYDSLHIYSDKLQEGIMVPLLAHGDKKKLSVWDRNEYGLKADQHINDFLSAHFDENLYLYYIRHNESQFSSFHDDSPFLVCNKASIEFLEKETDRVIDILRFRPNIVINSGIEFEEGRWSGVEIGGNTFKSIKLCSRCIVVNQDPHTSKVDMNVLKMLKPYTGNLFKIKFGLYLKSLQDGELSIGDALKSY